MQHADTYTKNQKRCQMRKAKGPNHDFRAEHAFTPTDSKKNPSPRLQLGALHPAANGGG